MYVIFLVNPYLLKDIILFRHNIVSSLEREMWKCALLKKERTSIAKKTVSQISLKPL